MTYNYKPVPAALRQRRPVSADGRRWGTAQRLEAVQTYLMLGNLTLTASVLKIPRDTLKGWKSKEWWKEMENDLKVQDDLQLGNRLKKIISKSYDVIEDRLENGDYIYDSREGVMKRKPVSMKDTHLVARDLIEKREYLVNRHLEEKSVSEDKVAKTLENLAKSFAEIANNVNKKPDVLVTDVILGRNTSETNQDATSEQNNGEA